MALGAPTTLLDADSSRSYGTGSYTTGSSSAPTSGSILVALVSYCTNGGGNPGVNITISDSQSHTWSEPVAQQRRTGSGTDYIGQAFFTAANSSTSTFTVTVDTSAGNIYAWEVLVCELTGASSATIGTTGSVSSSGNGAVSITLATNPVSSSYVLAGLTTYETNDNTLQITPGAGWTERAESGKSVPNSQIQYRTSSTSTSVDWSDNGTSVTGYLGLAFEIKEASATTHDASGSTSATGSATGALTYTGVATASASATGSLTGSVIYVGVSGGTASATGSVTATAIRTAVVTGAISAAGTATATATYIALPTGAASATAFATGALIYTGVATGSTSATFTLSGTLAALLSNYIADALYVGTVPVDKAYWGTIRVY